MVSWDHEALCFFFIRSVVRRFNIATCYIRFLGTNGTQGNGRSRLFSLVLHATYNLRAGVGWTTCVGTRFFGDNIAL